MKSTRHAASLARLCALMVASGAVAQAPRPQIAARIHLDPGDHLFVNQVATLTLEIEARGISVDSSFEFRWQHDESQLRFGEREELAMSRTREDAQVVETRRFRWRIRAPKSGKVELAATVMGQAVQYRGMSGGFRVLTPYRVSTPPVWLSVEEIPDVGRPPGFDGAIGSFELQTTVSPTNVTPGDLVTVRTRVEGLGYLEGCRPPETRPEKHFRVYPPRQLEQREGAAPVFEQTLIPQSTNAVSLPPVTMTFFDPIQKRFRVASSGWFSLAYTQRETNRVERFTGGAETDTTLHALQVVARSMERGRWSAATRKTVAEAVYWIVGLSMAGLLAGSRAGRGRRWLAALLVLLLALALFAPYRSVVQRFSGGGAVAKVTRDVTARVAPSSRAVATFELASQSGVEVEESFQGWVRVAHGVRRGWIPSDALSSVARQGETQTVARGTEPGR